MSFKKFSILNDHDDDITPSKDQQLTWMVCAWE